MIKNSIDYANALHLARHYAGQVVAFIALDGSETQVFQKNGELYEASHNSLSQATVIWEKVHENRLDRIISVNPLHLTLQQPAASTGVRAHQQSSHQRPSPPRPTAIGEKLLQDHQRLFSQYELPSKGLTRRKRRSAEAFATIDSQAVQKKSGRKKASVQDLPKDRYAGLITLGFLPEEIARIVGYTGGSIAVQALLDYSEELQKNGLSKEELLDIVCQRAGGSALKIFAQYYSILIAHGCRETDIRIIAARRDYSLLRLTALINYVRRRPYMGLLAAELVKNMPRPNSNELDIALNNLEEHRT